VLRDLPVDGRYQPSQPVQMIRFGIRQLQGARERGDHLRRRPGGPSLLQADEVVDRDPGDLGQLFPA
jgi:hypothetical protein